MKRKIYVASSWRNEYYPEVVEKLREAGHEVYDFRNPWRLATLACWCYLAAEVHIRKQVGL